MNAGSVLVLYHTIDFLLGWNGARRWQHRFHSTPEGDNLLTNLPGGGKRGERWTRRDERVFGLFLRVQ